MECFFSFVPVLNWLADQEPHFFNKVIDTLATYLGAEHRFSTAYDTWSNGTVEYVWKEILRVLHTFNSETRTPEADWPDYVPAIQSIINNSLSIWLGGRAPITVYTGMYSGNTLIVTLAEQKINKTQSIDRYQLLQRLNGISMLKYLYETYMNFNETISRFRKQSINIHNAETHVIT